MRFSFFRRPCAPAWSLIALILPTLAQAQSTKAIQVNPGVPVTVAAIAYADTSSCTSLGTGAFSVTQPPSHGELYFTEEVSPLPPGTCSQISLPTDVADYTWTDTSGAATTDMFQLHYSSADGATAQNITVSVSLIATQPASSVHPLIFIPGITGSTLDIVDPNDPGNVEELWPGLLANHLLLSLYPEDSPSPNVQALDVVRSIGVFGITLEEIYQPLYDMFTAAGYREYKLPGDPAHTACDTAQITGDPTTNPNLFSFPYDWRKDIGSIAQDLASYIDCVQQFYPGQTVDLLTHSMGGMVARRYILDNSGSKVNALIAMASPWLGATEFLDVLQAGDFGLTRDPVYSNTIRYLTGSFAAAHELMPAQAFFDLGGTPMAENGWDFNTNGVTAETYVPDEFRLAIDQNYARSSCPGPFCPGDTSFDFHAYSNNGNNQDDWRADSTGVQYFDIGGYQTQSNQPYANTVGEVTATYWTSCQGASGPCTTKPYFDLSFVAGDGTVPFLSVSREGNGLDYNAPGTTETYIAFGTTYEHESMVKDPAVQSAIFEALAQADGSPSPAFQSARSVVTRDAQTSAGHPAPRGVSSAPPFPGSFVTVTQPYVYMKVNGGDNVYLTDVFGNTTGLLPNTTVLYGSVPGVTQHVLGPRLNGFAIPTVGDFVLHVTTSNEPIAIEARIGTDTSTTNTARFIDIAVPAGVSGQLAVQDGAIGTLNLDTDGSGTYSTTISATVAQSGSNAQDTTGPAISFNLSGTTLTITAQDDASGVKDVYYSLDGTNYQSYVSPITVDTNSAAAVYVYADDQARNRSAAIFPVMPSTPGVYSQGVVNGASFAPGAAVSPGSIVSAFGSAFGSSSGATVSVDDLSAYVFGVFPQQVNFQIPWELADVSAGAVVVSKVNGSSAPEWAGIVPFAPGIFTMNAMGTGQGAIVIATTGELAAAAGSVPGFDSRPANAGEYVSIYCTGLGAVSNQPPDGQLTPASPISETTSTASATVANLPATVSFAGLAPGFIGLYQVNVLLPPDVPAGDAQPVVLSIGGAISNTVTIAIQ